jgi:hypothetical protein
MPSSAIPSATKALGTTLVAATAKATPTTVDTIYRATARMDLVGLTVNNITAPGTAVQVFIGRRLEADSGATWEALISPSLDGGEFTRWTGRVAFSAGDELVAYAGTTNLITITAEMEL